MRRHVEAQVANLPFAIAKREVAHAGAMLGWDRQDFAPRQIDDAASTGNVVLIEVEHETVTEIFTGFGRQGVSAEAVAASAAIEALDYYQGPSWLTDLRPLPHADGLDCFG